MVDFADEDTQEGRAAVFEESIGGTCPTFEGFDIGEADDGRGIVGAGLMVAAKNAANAGIFEEFGVMEERRRESGN